MSLEGLGHAPQGLIARLMSVAIVERLEVIHIDQQDRERPVVFECLLPQACELFVEHATVLGPRQGIELDELGDQTTLEKARATPPIEVSGTHRTRGDAQAQKCASAHRKRQRGTRDQRRDRERYEHEQR